MNAEKPAIDIQGRNKMIPNFISKWIEKMENLVSRKQINTPQSQTKKQTDDVVEAIQKDRTPG